MTDLNIGQGQCQGTARLLIRPVRAAIQLGAAEDVLNASLRAVHHANRRGRPDDFIAIGFPAMRMGRDIMQAGHDLELVGSATSLSGFLSLDGIERLRHRGMIEMPQVEEVHFDPGTVGAAYVRDHRAYKHTAGWIRRSKARAERRGKPLGKDIKTKGHDPKMLTISVGDGLLHVREVVATYSGSSLIVSTYGLSSASTPAVLPIYPDSARAAEDAT